MCFNNFNIFMCLIIGFLVLIFVIVVIVMLSMVWLGDINELLELVVNDCYKKINIVNVIFGKVDDVVILLCNWLLMIDLVQIVNEQKIIEIFLVENIRFYDELGCLIINFEVCVRFDKVIEICKSYVVLCKEIDWFVIIGEKDVVIKLMLEKMVLL